MKDFLKMTNEEILKKNDGRRYNVCLMNPPYGDSGDTTMHLKFVDKCIDLANVVIDIMPFTFIIQPTNSTIKKYKERFSGRLENVEQLSGKVFDDVNSFFDPAIYVFKDNVENTEIQFSNGHTKTVKHLNEVNKFNNYEEQFIKYLDNNGNINAVWAGGHNHCTVQSLAREGITNEKEVWYIIDKAIEDSCKKLEDNKVILQLSENGYAQDGHFFEKHTGNIFNSKREVIDFMQQYGRKSSRGFFFIMLDTKEEIENLKEALNRPLMRFCLYKTQYSKLISIKNNYKYIPDIDWSDDRVKTDEGLLEVCGCPKDKCKEYADYCKKIIEELDAKK